MKHIELSEICNALEKQVHYGEAGIDPAEAMETLFFGWAKQQQRLYKRAVRTFYAKWDQGWLQDHEARSFCDYCIRGWCPEFLEWH
jgi:hypothetical protein